MCTTYGTKMTGIAGLILDVDRDENSDYDEDDREFLKTLFKPFLTFDILQL